MVKIEISESADGERLKIIFGGTFVVELDSLDASTLGQKLADRARYSCSLDRENWRRTETSEVETGPREVLHESVPDVRAAGDN